MPSKVFAKPYCAVRGNGESARSVAWIQNIREYLAMTIAFCAVLDDMDLYVCLCAAYQDHE